MIPTPRMLALASFDYQRLLPPPPPLPPPLLPNPLSDFSDFRMSRHDLQRIGSLKPRDWKNSCSPAVKMNFCPQSLQFISLSCVIVLTPLNLILLHFCGQLDC